MLASTAMNPQHTNTNLSATLRPRNRRLISLDDEFETVDSDASSAIVARSSGLSSFAASRNASPIPSQHPSRSTSTIRQPPRLPSNGGLLGVSTPRSSSMTPNFSRVGFWGSPWSSLQEIASTLLGNDLVEPRKDKPGGVTTSPGRGRTGQGPHSRKFGQASPGEWGPAGNMEPQFAYGSQEDRLAQVQTKKREALLAADGSAGQDSLGRHKRRISVEQAASSSHSEADEEALIYLHNVQPEDTLAGVAIKYNCAVAVIRKANRLWPNDRIQIRQTVYLPLDACGVKGRKITDVTSNQDMIESTIEDSTPVPTPKSAPPNWGSSIRSHNSQHHGDRSTTKTPSIATSSMEDPPWKHDSWVAIDSFPSPVQIARLPRRTLGFFPPSRRKSIGYSDIESIPSQSLDLPQLPEPNPTGERYASPRRHESRSSSSYISAALRGPGGVGTLGSDIRSPGPPPDKLNQLFASHLPNVAPRASFESVHSTSSAGIENVGGAIEGWVRKMATKAAYAVQTPPLGVASGSGDLIELVEGWELDVTAGEGPVEREWRETAQGTARDDEERMLRERFPVRGRVFEDEGRKK